MGWLAGRTDKVKAEITRLLLVSPSRDLAAGWRLCEGLGQPAAPLLWEMVEAERSNLQRRLALLVGAMLAGGGQEDRRLVAWLGQPRPVFEERCLLALVVALGPPRGRPLDDYFSLAVGGNRTPEQFLAIAARLAAARVPSAVAALPVVAGGDPGLAGASAYCGAGVAPRTAEALWNLRNPDEHGELFWRGSMLGLARSEVGTGTALARARELRMLTGTGHTAARATAAIALARHGQAVGSETRPDWDEVLPWVVDQRSAMQVRDWLAPETPARVANPGRLAVAYALSRSPEEVLADRAIWLADPRVRSHVAIALAWQLAGREAQSAPAVGEADLPEWDLVRCCAGLRPLGRQPSPDDPQLAAAQRLLVDGRLSVTAARDLCEDTLWRWGSHPGLTRWEQERLLIRDLLLVGSHQGGSKYLPHVPPVARYRATGLGPDSPFYDLGVALYDFLAAPRLPVPKGYTLR